MIITGDRHDPRDRPLDPGVLMNLRLRQDRRHRRSSSATTKTPEDPQQTVN
jgi:hypothetical protein